MKSRGRSSGYERKGGDLQDIEELSQKLTADLQKHIHLIASCPVLSEPWCKMADLVGRIASISDMEARLPKEHANATLWECEEVALRYVMEDGKLNLCLRNLVEFRAFLRECKGRTSHLDGAPPAYLPEAGEAKTGGSSETWQQSKLDVFEKGMGVMLRNAWSHVEAVQTTDLPMLIQHVGDVLHDACSPDGAERMRAPVWKSNLQPDFNVRVIARFGPDSSALLRELAESNRFIQKSAESTSI